MNSAEHGRSPCFEMSSKDFSAVSSVLNSAINNWFSVGFGMRRSVISVIIASVPSLPIKIFFKF